MQTLEETKKLTLFNDFVSRQVDYHMLRKIGYAALYMKQHNISPDVFNEIFHDGLAVQWEKNPELLASAIRATEETDARILKQQASSNVHTSAEHQ